MRQEAVGGGKRWVHHVEVGGLPGRLSKEMRARGRPSSSTLSPADDHGSSSGNRPKEPPPTTRSFFFFLKPFASMPEEE